jgi:hypothetical protein
VDAEDLKLEADRLVNAALASNTRRAYNAGTDSIYNFHQLMGYEMVWPVPLDKMVQYVAFLSKKGLAACSVNTYLAGISNKHKLLNCPDSTQNFIIRRMVAGMARGQIRKDVRAPITIDILRKIVPALDYICHSSFESVMFRASFVLAFFGFFRISELVAQSASCSDRALQSQDVVVNVAKELHVTIRYSKTDQLGRSTNLVIKKIEGDSICPVNAMIGYIAVRPAIVGPLFCHYNHAPLTRYQFSTVLQRALTFAGIDTGLFSSHSFRIGCSTTAYMNGVSTDEIKRMGRWDSEAYKLYIRV